MATSNLSYFDINNNEKNSAKLINLKRLPNNDSFLKSNSQSSIQTSTPSSLSSSNNNKKVNILRKFKQQQQDKRVTSNNNINNQSSWSKFKSRYYFYL
jgi:hypothetical protein